MPTGLEDFCDGLGCGYSRPIVRTKLVRVKTPFGGVHIKELKFCRECAGREDKDTADVVRTLGQPLVDTTEEIRNIWEAEQVRRARKVPKAVSQEIAGETAYTLRDLRRWFQRGFILGAILATGIAFAFFNFIRGWS